MYGAGNLAVIVRVLENQRALKPTVLNCDFGVPTVDVINAISVDVAVNCVVTLAQQLSVDVSTSGGKRQISNRDDSGLG